ncbi:hypothetical protein P5W99_36590 [Paraburkholderia sp. A3BS-1L]|uniref:hypothetical protein n=1 Tax=Paraburkholderia sp. A3BS-1L TaxID=3028375 RepID=UPI003DA7CAAE
MEHDLGGWRTPRILCPVLADVQVTLKWEDPSRPTQYVDALKKIHILCDGLVIAFSGTIRIAFEVIDWLRRVCVPTLTANLFSEPDEVARRVVRHIKHGYSKAKKKEGERVSFLLFILNKSSMDRDVGVYKVCSSKFELETPQRAFHMLEIGSGAEVGDYREIVERHSVPGYSVEDPDEDLPALVIPTGPVALKYLQEEASDFQNAGISRAMHLMLIYSGGTTIIERPAIPESVFPRVAGSWDELVSFLGARGIDLAACSASA